MPAARAARAVLATLFALAAVLAAQPPPADAALPFRLPLLSPKPPPAPVIPPVAEPISADPAGAARGTMIMVHAGGWAGHDAYAQEQLVKSPGDLFLGRGWRVMSIDYESGADGLQDVLAAAGAELARKTGDGPLCIYGESSGAHLALVAASRLRAIDCVVGLGTPTDLSLYGAEAASSGDARLRLVASQIDRYFGTAAPQSALWDLVALAPAIHSDVLLVRETDDAVVSSLHSARFAAVRPTTQLVELAPGDPADASTDFMHGTISEAGRAQYAAALGSFADRAVAARDAERSAARTGCSGVNRSVAEVGVQGLRSALRCLARKDAEARGARIGGWQRTSVKLRGEVTAARIWANLRATRSGRRALVAAAKRRIQVTVRAGDRSKVILRAAR